MRLHGSNPVHHICSILSVISLWNPIYLAEFSVLYKLNFSFYLFYSPKSFMSNKREYGKFNTLILRNVCTQNDHKIRNKINLPHSPGDSLMKVTGMIGTRTSFCWILGTNSKTTSSSSHIFFWLYILGVILDTHRQWLDIQGVGGFSPKIPSQVCTAQWGRDFATTSPTFCTL